MRPDFPHEPNHERHRNRDRDCRPVRREPVQGDVDRAQDRTNQEDIPDEIAHGEILDDETLASV